MKKTKLIEIIGKLSDFELLSFKDWLNSPVHNKSEHLKTLYEWILKSKPYFESEKLNKRIAFKLLYSNEVYNELKINNLISQLTRQAFDFLAFANYRDSNHLKELCLLDELQQRNLNKLMLQEAKRLDKKRTKSTIQNASHFFENYMFYKQLDERFLKQPKREYDENLQLKNDNLDVFYINTKLKIACDMLSRKTVIKANYETHHFDDLEKWLQTNQRYLNFPSVAIYYQVYQTIKKGKIEIYQRLKQLLQENLEVFPKAELSRIYDYILNFCIRQINHGKTDFYREILDVYKFLLNNQIIFQNGYLAQWDYKNIITVGTRIGEIKWTENFINEYKKDLPPKERENAFVYNKANFYYSTKAYKKSLQLLHEVKFTDTSYHLGAKIIQLKSYYELEENEPFYALIDAFKIYMMRNREISTYWKQANLNFVKLAKRIFKLKEQQFLIPPSVFMTKWKSISDRLEKMENVANKAWLETCMLRLSKS
ncbi:MAG: hypothetical protein AB8G11_22520 [Saprospiraceae bacterium]